MKLRSFFQALCLIMLCLIPLLAAAETTTKWIKVELLIFKQANGSQKSEEIWPEHPGEPQLRNGIMLNPWQEPVLPYTMLPKEQWQLTGAELALDRQGQHEILGHLAWVQPRKSKKEIESVQIIPDDLSPDESPLTGLASVSYSRYPHLSFDLLLKDFQHPLEAPSSEPVASTEVDLTTAWPHDASPSYFNWIMPDEAKPILDEAKSAPTRYQSYRFRDSVRLTLNRLKYLDHPMLGILVKITAFTPPEVPPGEVVESGDAKVPVVPKKPQKAKPSKDYGYM